jgi:hypothetical protein
MAQRLISRNKLAEALDLLNETVRQAPRLAETFEHRAVVFDALGMHPQAEADRRKAAALRADQPPAPPPSAAPGPPGSGPKAEELQGVVLPIDEAARGDEVAPLDAPAESEDAGVETEDASASPEPSGEPPDGPPPPVMPSYPPAPRPSTGGALLRAAGVVLFALGIFIVAGVGIYLGLDQIRGDSDGSATAPPTASAASSATAEASDVTGDATDVPPTVEEALSGSPYSFSNLEVAWHARALAVSVGEVSESVTGFGEPAVDMTLTGNGATMELSVLVYASADAKDEEWTLGVAPQPKGAGVLPAGASVWYNANVVVVVRKSDPALRQDALDGFLALS